MDASWKEKGRFFLKSRWPELKEIETDRQKRAELPAMQKAAETEMIISLSDSEELTERFGKEISLTGAFLARETNRVYTEASLSQDELAYLLWAVQGVRMKKPRVSFRTVPSGGARHPFETYLFVQRVTGLEPGLYRYLPLDHQLVFIKPAGEYGDNLEDLLDEALLKHNFHGAVTFIWTAIPRRSEWSYASEAARLILLDAGHMVGHLYLACQAVGCGTCAVGAFDQQQTDKLLGVDGIDEFTVYTAPVGKLKEKGSVQFRSS